MTINEANFNKLKQDLAARLYQGCDNASEIVKEVTPIDTKRLWTSTRADELQINQDLIGCKVVAGGEKLYGVLREQDIKKEVDYAIYVEAKYGYVVSVLPDVKEALLNAISQPTSNGFSVSEEQ